MSDEYPWLGRRTWTPTEAAAALPLVRRIVEDLVLTYRRWQETVEAFEYATSGSKADEPNPDAEQLMVNAQKRAAEIDGFRAELAQLDIRVTRVECGVIAFRSEKAGEAVPLFWVPGAAAPGYDCPESVTVKGTSIS